MKRRSLKLAVLNASVEDLSKRQLPVVLYVCLHPDTCTTCRPPGEE